MMRDGFVNRYEASREVNSIKRPVRNLLDELSDMPFSIKPRDCVCFYIGGTEKVVLDTKKEIVKDLIKLYEKYLKKC